MTAGIRLIGSEEEARDLIGSLGTKDRFCLDCETNGLFAFKARVCLMQFAASRDEVFILDTLRVRPVPGLRELLLNPAVTKILHGASHDVASLKDDLGTGISGIHDTYILASFLGKEHLGLADLIERYFGVRLSKRLQKCDWAIRPLDEAHISYLAGDVGFLPGLHEILIEEARAADVLEEALLEFKRVEETLPTPHPFNPTAYLKFRGASALSGIELSILRELDHLRAEVAERLDRPIFKVASNGALMGAARYAASGAKISRCHALRKTRLSREKGLAAAVERGRKRGAIPPEDLERPRRERARRGKRGKRYRLEALKAWRSEESARRGVVPAVVLPNPVMDEIAAASPGSPEDLANIHGLGEKRIKLYGERMIEILEKADRAEGTRRGR